MSVRCECCVLSGRGLCDELITRPEESYRLWCIVVCDLETSRIGAPYINDISNLRVKHNRMSSTKIKFGCISSTNNPKTNLRILYYSLPC